MLFNSYAFLFVFLPAAIAVHRIVDGYPPLRTWTLILLSLVFYGYWNAWFLILLIGSIVVNWLAANAFAATRKGAIITGAVVFNLAVLGVFKYANFFAENLASILSVPVAHLDIVLPLGISFFTFHHVMYLVDLRRGKTGTYPLDRYALYICFFPQAIAGPLARWSEVMHQFGRQAFAPGWERRCAAGVTFILIGLVEKALGDAMGALVDPVYTLARTGAVPVGSAWVTLGFGFQIFLDFAGYSNIAIGLGLIFDIELPRNFNAPFRASDILDFWQRWHMTLTRFLRDYVFFPLVDLRLVRRRYRVAQFLSAIVVTMALCGLWHGAGWNFALWGTVHGIAMVLAVAWQRYLPSLPAPVGCVATICFVLLTAILFRAGTLDAAWRLYEGLAAAPELFWLRGWRTSIPALAAMAYALFMPASHVLCERLNERPRFVVAAVLGLVGTAVLFQLNQENHEFIYFQF
jgi:alginate O-acetyltransferase complex protein AlgI